MEPHLNKQPLTTAPSVPGYDIVGYLGTGGMASVYLAIDMAYGRQVALKVMSPVLAADPQYAERFVHEARIAASLDHPNIVEIHEFGEQDRRCYFIMEHLPGGDLAARIRARVTSHQAIAIIRQIAAALACAHDHGVLHGDVKPENILFRADDSAVLTDFGIARPSARSSQDTQLGVVVGTPQYMSPEQIRGRAADTRSDLYALGIVLYELLTGVVPFDGKDPVAIGIQHARSPIPRLPDELRALQPVLDRLLAKEASERYRDARQLIDALDALGTVPPKAPPRERDGADDAATAPSPVPPPESKGDASSPEAGGPRRRSHWRALTALTATAALGGAWYYADSSGRLQPALLELRSHPGYQHARTSLDGWRAALQAHETTLLEWLAATKARLAADADGVDHAEDAATAEEEAFVAATSGSIGASILAQTLPGLPSSAGVAAQASGVLAGLRLATIPRLDKQTEIINEMLSRAAHLLNAGKLTAPADANALQAYREVLTLDEHNAAAIAGIEAVLLGLLNGIDNALERGETERAQSMIDAARAAELDAGPLDAAQARLDAAGGSAPSQGAGESAGSAAAARPQPTTPPGRTGENAENLLVRLRVTGLLRNAAFDIGEGRYTGPQGNNALQKYREVLRLDPANEMAREGLQALADRIATELDTASASGDHVLYESRLADLALVAPRHPQLSNGASAASLE